jgi:hypothetical protein
MAAELGLRFDDRYFAPEFLTYLREARPPHWAQRNGPFEMFDDIARSVIATIAPADVLYVAETWPEDSVDFADDYLVGHGFLPEDVPDPIAVLRSLVAQHD